MKKTVLSALVVAAVAGGCIQVKTESEIKPIHITMDVNLKVDRQLDQALASDDYARPGAEFRQARELMNAGKAGLTNQALLEARSGASDDDRLFIADYNAKRLRRYGEIARQNNVTLESVQKRSAGKILGRIPAGSGVYYQDDQGVWQRR